MGKISNRRKGTGAPKAEMRDFGFLDDYDSDYSIEKGFELLRYGS